MKDSKRITTFKFVEKLDRMFNAYKANLWAYAVDEGRSSEQAMAIQKIDHDLRCSATKRKMLFEKGCDWWRQIKKPIIG